MNDKSDGHSCSVQPPIAWVCVVNRFWIAQTHLHFGENRDFVRIESLLLEPAYCRTKLCDYGLSDPFSGYFYCSRTNGYRSIFDWAICIASQEAYPARLQGTVLVCAGLYDNYPRAFLV